MARPDHTTTTTTTIAGGRRRRRPPGLLPTALVAVLLAALAGAAGCSAGPAALPAPAPTAVVVALVDGDTLDVRLDAGGVERVRLLGIDTPESVDPDRPVECHGPEAARALAALLPVGTVVRLERDEEARDHFGRLLAYVFRHADGMFVNEALLAAGEAERLEIPPNTAYRSVLEPAAAGARAAGAGVWGDCPDRPP